MIIRTRHCGHCKKVVQVKMGAIAWGFIVAELLAVLLIVWGQSTDTSPKLFVYLLAAIICGHLIYEFMQEDKSFPCPNCKKETGETTQSRFWMRSVYLGRFLLVIFFAIVLTFIFQFMQ
mgnify:FL=1|jgi:hypothetical protein